MGFGNLYFIWSPKARLVKIGATYGTARARMRELQQAGQCCDCADSYEIVREIPNAGYYERDLHKALAASRRRGEWFEITPPLQLILSGRIGVGQFLYPRRRAYLADPLRRS